MKVTIYGKDNCPNCDKTKMLCEIKSLEFAHYTVGADISIEALQEKVGKAVRALPQIFLHRDGETEYVGGYDDLRTVLA